MSLHSLKLAMALALGMIPGASFAQSVEESIISQLAEQGFTNISVSRTLLGRTRIKAQSSTLSREIVFNPTTGVILRDYWEDLDEDDGRGNRLVNPSRPTDGSNSSPAGTSPSGSDDDDDRDDDDDGLATGSDDTDDDDDDDRDDDDDDDRDDDDD